MGNNQSIQKINFEDVQTIIKNPSMYLLMNTLPESEQNCLIINTILASEEENMINALLQRGKKHKHIVIYGRNTNDEKMYEKYNQLSKLGFYNIFIYCGGIFEWLMLQDIYGMNEFPTTCKQHDFLKYKPRKILHAGLLEY